MYETSGREAHGYDARHEDTVQLRSPWAGVPDARTSRQAAPPAPVVERVTAQPDQASIAVFVDQSGRRGRALRRFGWLAGVLVGGFAATAVTTVAGANAQAPDLVIPDQPASSVSAAPSASASAPPSTPPPTVTPTASPSASATRGKAATTTPTGRAGTPTGRASTPAGRAATPGSTHGSTHGGTAAKPR
ncbi:hypothetical protein [Kitasatospora atroaurantiaca]|uniref:hypothetical protein n=1 Tax=Kitasatospora atroaurantiaca TaxID=285545 RepID=UPI00119F4864|nr:hypothetical protein [Kitasatospora atroaurantiaca]